MGKHSGKTRKDIDERDLRTVEEAAGLGLTQDDIGRLVGANPATFVNWLKVDDELREAYDKGKAIAKRKVARRLFEIIESESRESAAAVFFYLKCQCGWREADKSDTQQTAQEIKIYLPEKITENNDNKE